MLPTINGAVALDLRTLTHFASMHVACDMGQGLADQNGAPVGIWRRDGSHVVCEIDPESITPEPESLGWALVAIVDPTEKE
jgi:hypothetical protein